MRIFFPKKVRNKACFPIESPCKKLINSIKSTTEFYTKNHHGIMVNDFFYGNFPLQKGRLVSKKKLKKVYKYECTITGEVFKTTAEAKNPSELMSVKSYYDLNPDHDDRPMDIKLTLKNEEIDQQNADALAEATPTK